MALILKGTFGGLDVHQNTSNIPIQCIGLAKDQANVITQLHNHIEIVRILQGSIYFHNIKLTL